MASPAPTALRRCSGSGSRASGAIGLSKSTVCAGVQDRHGCQAEGVSGAGPLGRSSSWSWSAEIPGKSRGLVRPGVDHVAERLRIRAPGAHQAVYPVTTRRDALCRVLEVSLSRSVASITFSLGAVATEPSIDSRARVGSATLTARIRGSARGFEEDPTDRPGSMRSLQEEGQRKSRIRKRVPAKAHA